jgi:hypothetical protein
MLFSKWYERMKYRYKRIKYLIVLRYKLWLFKQLIKKVVKYHFKEENLVEFPWSTLGELRSFFDQVYQDVPFNKLAVDFVLMEKILRRLSQSPRRSRKEAAKDRVEDGYSMVDKEQFERLLGLFNPIPPKSFVYKRVIRKRVKK